MTSYYTFGSARDADDAYAAFQRAAALPRKTPGWHHVGRGPHAVRPDTFNPGADRNPGWDRDETGPVRKHPTREEYSLQSTPDAQRHEGKTVDVDGVDVELPKASDRKDLGVDWVELAEV